MDSRCWLNIEFVTIQCEAFRQERFQPKPLKRPSMTDEDLRTMGGSPKLTHDIFENGKTLSDTLLLREFRIVVTRRWAELHLSCVLSIYLLKHRSKLCHPNFDTKRC